MTYDEAWKNLLEGGGKRIMAVYDNRPLSWGERMALANNLRREAAEKIAEAQRIEDGLQADQDAVYESIEKSKMTPNAELRPLDAALCGKSPAP